MNQPNKRPTNPITVQVAALLATLLGTLWLPAALAQPPATQPEAATGAPAAEKTAVTKDKQDEGFVRLRRDPKSDEPIALDVAIVRYRVDVDGKPATVDLVGAVHIGEKSYYEQLNKRFASYDAVLYELVAPKGTVIPRGGRKTKSRHPVSMLQRGMKNMLELEFQLEQIDYTPKHFVHADMTPTEFAQSMKDRGESFFKIMIRAMKLSMKQQLESDGKENAMPSDFDILRALLSKDRALKMKRLMAGQLANMEGQLDIFGGPEGSTLITERNKRALEVLRQELDNGKRNIAVFYGAGHLPDMDQRLKDEFHAKRVSTEWLTAWKMEDPPQQNATEQDADKQATDEEVTDKQDIGKQDASAGVGKQGESQ